MKQWFLNLVGSTSDLFIKFFTSKWNVLFLLFVNPIIGMIALVLYVFGKVEGYFNAMIDSGTNSLGQITSFNFGTAVGIANYFVPVDMMFFCASGLMGLYIAALTYRFIKSWVPTLS